MPIDPTAGKIVKVYRVECAECHNYLDINPSWSEELGRFLLYIETAEVALRQLYGWGTRKGVWYCHNCLHPED
jgi:hypothetical protein